MSFRKRNVGLSSGRVPPVPALDENEAPSSPGVRPSPLDGRLVTSTGSASLDGLLAGHTGLALGTSMLLEESGTTDFAGALLRYFAAEGVVQQHVVHVVGLSPQWGRELPGLAGVADHTHAGEEKQKMKIAWRYERLGEFGAGIAGARGGFPFSAS